MNKIMNSGLSGSFANDAGLHSRTRRFVARSFVPVDTSLVNDQTRIETLSREHYVIKSEITCTEYFILCDIYSDDNYAQIAVPVKKDDSVLTFKG